MKKLLIIEDDQIVANIYRNKFSVEGFQVEVALDGESGLELVGRFEPDVIVLDLMLPRLSGIEVLRRLRAEPASRRVPVVVFSNTYLSNLVQEAWKAGATKCLSKANCTPQQVMEVVRRIVTAGEPAPSTPPGTPAPAASTPSRPAPDDEVVQAEWRRSFVETLPRLLAALRVMVALLVKSPGEVERLKQLRALCHRIHGLTGSAGMGGMPPIAMLAEALEALLQELCDKPRAINASTLRTVAHAVDFLGLLFERSTGADGREVPAAKILVVDDEPLSRRAIAQALERAKLKSVNVEDPQFALKLLAENEFDLIFLDVDMPQMNGFELCAKLRALPAHAATPVVFVTALNDFESRANSTISGGNDFIAKPFLFVELAVKALIYVLQDRRNQPKTPRGRTPVAPAAVARRF